MLEGYKPIDFGTMFSGQGDLSQIRNRVGLSQAAQNILANSTFSKTPIQTLLDAGLSATGEAPKRKQNLWGRAVDFFSMPAYAVSNAVDDAIAGHQSDDYDSVLRDAMQVVGGIVTGAGRGVGTGLRGAFAPSETAADPMDKIYLGDALVRWDTHMSAEDARKPENLEKIRQRLAGKKINMFSDDDKDKYFYDWDKGKVEVTDDDIEQYFEDMHLYGLAASMVGDPINFIGGGAKVAAATRGAKGTAETFDASMLPKINEGLPKDVNPQAFGKADGSYKVKLPAKNPDGTYKVTLAPGTIQNSIVSPETGALIKPPSWFDFPANAGEVNLGGVAPKIDEIAPPVIPTATDTVTLGGKVRGATPLARTAQTVDDIPQGAWDDALNLSQRPGIPDWMFEALLGQKHGLTTRAIGEVLGHIRAGTEPTIGAAKSPVARTAPVANDIDPFETIINAPATGIAGESKLKNPITAKGDEITLPYVRPPDAQVRVAHKYSQPEEITKFTKDLLGRVSTEGVDNAIQRIAVKHPGMEFTRTNQLLEHLKTIPDFAARLKIPAENKKIVAAFNRVIHADAQSLKVPAKVAGAQEIIKNSQGSSLALNRLIEGAKGAPVASKNPSRDGKIIDALVSKYEPQLSLKQIPGGVRDAAKYRAAMESHGAYTGPKQVNVWNTLTSKHLVNVKTPARFKAALTILRVVESKFEAMGHIAMSSFPKAKNSVPLKLSQVLDAIGPAAAAMNPSLLTKILAGDPKALATLSKEALQQIEALKAGEAIVDGSNMVKGVDAASKSIEDLIKGPLSAADTEGIVTIGSKVAEDITRQAGGSGVAGQKAAQAIKDEFIPVAPGDGFSTVKNTAYMAGEGTAKSYKNFSNANKVSQDIVKAIGGPTPRALGTKAGQAARAVEWLGARFNAAYKNPDMRPIYLEHAASAKSTVALRAQYMNRLAKRFNVNDADLWNDAVKGAQGRQAPLPGSEAEELSKEFLAIMRDLFGSSGLKSAVALENSVAGRSQLLMKELNANLKRFGMGQYKFEKTGEYAKGVDWLNSWEKWDIANPLEFLFRVQNVVEHTAREKLMFDEIIARFAAPQKVNGFTHAVNHPRLQGYYFGPEAASQINQFTKMLKEVSTPGSKSMQNFDKALSKWKAAVTIYVPSHHIRNLIGDVYFNWLAGVNSTRPYGTAIKVMQSQKGRYEGLEGISQLTNPNALKQAMATGGYTAAGKQTALTMRNGQNITNDMLYTGLFQKGVLPTTRVLEDIPQDAITGLDKFKPLGGRGQKAAHTISEGRDHYVRIAHGIDVLKKSNKPFEAALEDAAAAIRKWHPDGMDLTKFERTVMRRMFPFYSWTRKAFPLILESMVATPGKVMAIPKGQYFLQNLMGIETGPMSDPFPYDQLFPDWMRERGIGPVAGPDSMLTGILGGQPGYSVVNPGNPTMDIIANANHPGKMFMQNLNPAARIPIEAMTGVDTQTGAPVDVTDTDYIAKQLPGISHVGRASGEFGVSDTTKENSSGYNIQALLNMILGMGVQNSGPYQKSAQFDLRDYIKEMRG